MALLRGFWRSKPLGNGDAELALLGVRLRRLLADPASRAGVAWLAGVAVLLDLWLTGLWFFRMQVDPDLSRVAGPVASYAHVLHDPFGFAGLRTGLRYPGAGRSMAHLTTKVWADHALGWIHVFVSDPVRALYLGLAITAVLVHLGFLVVGCKYLRAYQPMSAASTLCCAFVLSLFVQLATQRFYVGIIDHSMSYTFAYAIPLLVLAAWVPKLPALHSQLSNAAPRNPHRRVFVRLAGSSFLERSFCRPANNRSNGRCNSPKAIRNPAGSGAKSRQSARGDPYVRGSRCRVESSWVQQIRVSAFEQRLSAEGLRTTPEPKCSAGFDPSHLSDPHGNRWCPRRS